MKNFRFISTVVLIFIPQYAFAQDSTAAEIIAPDTLPGIIELPTLNLTAPETKEAKTSDISSVLIRKENELDSPVTRLDENIPTGQQELINRLKYKKKESSKIKKYKPQVNISVVDQDAERWKNK